jgi:hypothetical protein
MMTSGAYPLPWCLIVMGDIPPANLVVGSRTSNGHFRYEEGGNEVGAEIS